MTNPVRYTDYDRPGFKAGCLKYGERKVKRKLIYLALVLLLAGAAMAQEVSIRADHPDEYVVVEGDTLWDIAGKFLDYPWQWPTIWHANQQIDNPHLIYPGDVLSLVFIDGQPRLMVDRGKPVMKLSPSARATRREPIRAINHEEIAGYIRNLRLVTPEEFEALPYIVANYERRELVSNTDLTYARGLQGEEGSRYAIVRLANIYYWKKGVKYRAVEPGYGQHAATYEEYHPGFWENLAYWGGNRGDVIGFELYEVGQAVLSKPGDPATLTNVTGLDAVQAGDLVVPLDTLGYPENYMPHAMDQVPDNLRVLGVQGGNRVVGHQKVVSISGGSRQGIEPGHVFSAFEPGKRVRDEVKYPAGSLADASTWNKDKVYLPDEFEGHIMVFRVFDEVSYALVMSGKRFVHENDILKHPDETM